MTEGNFPKVDGDVLYASEVNKFATNLHSAYGKSIGSNTSADWESGTFANITDGNISTYYIGSYINKQPSFSCSIPEGYYHQVIVSWDLTKSSPNNHQVAVYVSGANSLDIVGSYFGGPGSFYGRYNITGPYKYDKIVMTASHLQAGSITFKINELGII
jgi:hypothetical protein